MDESLDLKDFLRVLNHRRWLVAVAMAALSGLMLYRASNTEPTYNATAKVVIGPDSVSRAAVRTDLSFLVLSSKDYVSSFAEQLEGRPLAEQVVERMGLDVLPTSLAGNISTSIVKDTRIIEVTYTDSDPARAALIANGVVDTFVATQKRQGTVEGLQAAPFEAALVPSSPVGPRPVRDGVMGLFLGAMLGLGAAVGLEQLDTRLRNRDQVESAVSPMKVLSEVPNAPRGDGRRLWLQTAPGTQAAESFRILRTNLQFLAVERRIKTLLVTSPSPQEGKTTVTANLAASLAAGGYRTLLVDGDLRHPTIQLYFDVEHAGGLSDVLAGTLALKDAIRPTGFNNLSVMTAGPQPPNPSELFGSQRMQQLVDSLQEDFDFVVFDAPPTLIVADAPALAANLDGVIFVVRSGQTTREQSKEALRRFALLDVRMLGAVLNASKRVRPESYYGYSSYSYLPSANADLDLHRDPDQIVQPAVTRRGPREKAGARSIDNILDDLDKLASRRSRRGDTGPRTKSDHAPTKRDLQGTPAEIVPMFDGPAVQTPSPEPSENEERRAPSADLP